MRDALRNRVAGLLTYGITPPKRSLNEERRRDVAARQAARISQLGVDALVVYDIQDEAARTQVERPFPFLETIDPATYAYDYLGELALPRIIYRGVASSTPAGLAETLCRVDAHGDAVVLVGAASREQEVSMRLPEAYEVRRAVCPALPLGGVLIAERHEAGRREDERAFEKMDRGCSFFVTQAAYSVVASKNVLSDLHYRADALERPLPPILVTLSPCGSTKTLEFMRWLGVSVPRWLENELTHSRDILHTSLDLCTELFADLHAFCASRNIPLGCNVESVSVRKEEIDASVELVHRVARLLGRSSFSGDVSG
jgi:hypothetical protein